VEREAVVRIYCAGREGIHTGFLKNLSAGGMFLHIVDPEPTGTRLHFELRLDPKRPATITGSGEVAFRREVYGGPGRPPGMGVRFLALTPEGAEELTRVVGEPPRATVVVGGNEPVPGGDLPWHFPVAEASLDPEVEILVPPDATDLSSDAEESRRSTASEHLLAPPDRGSAGLAGAPGFRSRFWIAAMALALLGLLAGWTWIRSLEERSSPPTGSSEAVSLAPDERPLPAETIADPEAPLPSAVAAAEPPPTVDPEPLARVESIAWEEGPDSLVVVVGGDGVFAEGQATYSHIGGEVPRGVVRIRGVERVTDRYREDLASDLVATIRTGFHQGSGGRGDLHLVLDFRDADARITGVLPAGDELLVYVGRP
jgi:uncharacterized protein (TIGR02266 family)